MYTPILYIYLQEHTHDSTHTWTSSHTSTYTPWITHPSHLIPEMAMAPYSSTLAWKIPWMEEPGRLQSMGFLRVGHDWATSLSLFTFHFHALEKDMATHSSVLAWRIPGTVEPGGLPSMGSHRVGHDWSNLAAAAPVHFHFLESYPWFIWKCKEPLVFSPLHTHTETQTETA